MEDTGRNFSIIKCKFGCNFSFIGKYVREYIKRTGTNPIIFIDYLQILQPIKEMEHRSTKESIDSILTGLKELSSELKLTIFLVSSLNRANYLSPIDFESFKESGGIEYTADVLLGLQLSCMDSIEFEKSGNLVGKRRTITEEKLKNPRRMELIVLKNRMGAAGEKLRFNYYPMFDLFQETKV